MLKQKSNFANALATTPVICTLIVYTSRIFRAKSVASNVTKIAKRNDSAMCLTATRSRPYRLLDRKPNAMMHKKKFRTEQEMPLA